MNTNNVNKIFKILGVKPNERFRIKGNNNTLPYLYKIDKSLTVLSFYEDNEKWKWKPIYSSTILKSLLNGTYTIVKFSKMTKKEKIAIDYAKACGYKWMAKDSDNKVFAYKEKPIKGNGKWYLAYGGDNIALIEIPISFIHFYDDEPFCLENDLS